MEGISVHGQELGLFTGMAPVPPPFLPGFSFSGRCLRLTLLNDYATVVNGQAHGSCDLSHVLRDIPDETVKALVDCLVFTILLAVTTTTYLYCKCVSRCMCYAGSHK